MHKRVRSIVFTVSITFFKESGLAILNTDLAFPTWSVITVTEQNRKIHKTIDLCEASCVNNFKTNTCRCSKIYGNRYLCSPKIFFWHMLEYSQKCQEIFQWRVWGFPLTCIRFSAYCVNRNTSAFFMTK